MMRCRHDADERDVATIAIEHYADGRASLPLFSRYIRHEAAAELISVIFDARRRDAARITR